RFCFGNIQQPEYRHEIPDDDYDRYVCAQYCVQRLRHERQQQGNALCVQSVRVLDRDTDRCGHLSDCCDDLQKERYVLKERRMSMNFLNKLERKFGRYAIPHLTTYIIITYVIGYLLNYAFPSALGYMTLDPYMIIF